MTTGGSDGQGAPSAARLVRLYAEGAAIARIGAWECDLATEELTWTDGVYDLFELSRGSRLRRSAIVDLYVEESRRQMERMRAETIRTGERFVLEAQIRTDRGAHRWMRLSAAVAHRDGRPVRIFGAKQDITAEREAWDRLRGLADRDPLTGLVNRRVFDLHYREVIQDSASVAPVAALVLIDLDRFKAINDGLGHAAGDECLRQTARRLVRAFGHAVLVARIGGDEFAVLLGAPLGRPRIAHMLDRALQSLGRPILWNGIKIDANVSIGAAILDQPYGRRRAELFADADRALYGAKAAGRGAVRIFGDDPARTPGRTRLMG